MTVTDKARTWLDASRDGRILPDRAASLAGAGGIGAGMLELITVAAQWARPEISGFRVGAVGEGASGALYFGANLEFEGAALGETVHAEQAVVANAAAHGETGLLRLAVSAPPCGYCRQFLYELANAESLEILLAGMRPARIADFLPGAFGPADLGVVGGMLATAAHGLKAAGKTHALADAAVAAANASYAPYSKAYGGAAIRVSDGRIFTGFYLENAAFNPSLPPLQAAYVPAVLGGYAASDIESVAIAQPADAKVDHHGTGRALLARIAPNARVRRVALRG
ncbi:MAG TPA: cytidine deaminase [Allosphingosinicella sp.]